MKIFQCGHCDQPLFFENHKCENCGHFSGYRNEDRMMLTFDPDPALLISDREQIEYKYCKNNEHKVCNWILEKDDPNVFCTACQLNRTIPNLSDDQNFLKWKDLEIAKHRLIYQLLKLGLDLPSKMKDENGLCFDFVAKQNDPNLMTGHANGVITILVREADSSIREKMRVQLNEPYRTLIGHLRHEVGHYFWDQLVLPNPDVLSAFRELFGNEEDNYGEALKAHYANGAPKNWKDSYISEYATSHPWEDWAETWAHYLHIMDMVETAHFFGLTVKPTDVLSNMAAEMTIDPYEERDFKLVVNKCVPLSFAVNSINRAMGITDVYPFVITPVVVQKMTFIHKLIWSKR